MRTETTETQGVLPGMEQDRRDLRQRLADAGVEVATGVGGNPFRVAGSGSGLYVSRLVAAGALSVFARMMRDKEINFGTYMRARDDLASHLGTRLFHGSSHR